MKQSLESFSNLRITHRIEELLVELGLLGSGFFCLTGRLVLCVRVPLEAADHEEYLLDEIGAEPLIEFFYDEVFHVLELLHPDRAGDLHKQDSIADLFRLCIAGNGWTHDVVPNGPHAVFVQPRGEVKSFQGLLENRSEPLDLGVFVSHGFSLGASLANI